MKKVTKIPKRPELGDTRVVSYYSLFPVSIQKDTEIETRYLERVHIKQQYCCEFHQGHWEYYWKDIDFVEKETQNE